MLQDCEETLFWRHILIPNEDIVKKILAKHERDAKIFEAISFGFEAAKNNPDSGKWRRKTTRRHICWEAGVDKLIELLADDPGIQFLPHNDTMSFIFDDKVLVRLKNANITLRTSNFPTNLAELFHVHRADLFGYEGLQRVEAVYVADRFEAQLVWTGIVAREKKKHLWHFEVGPEAIPAAPVLPMPVAPQPPAETLAKLKDQGKGKKRPKKAKDGE